MLPCGYQGTLGGFERVARQFQAGFLLLVKVKRAHPQISGSVGFFTYFMTDQGKNHKSEHLEKLAELRA